MPRTPTPIPYFGGKAVMVKKLLPLIPDHRIYVEAFGGAASLLLAKDASPIEIYNDLNSGLVEFFRVLRDPAQVSELERLCTLTPYARQEFYDMRETWPTAPTPVERAHQWFLVARSSFSGLFAQSWGFSFGHSGRGMASAVSRYLGAIDRLPEISARLMRVQIEQRTAFRLFELYDSPETFWYLDPPYHPDTRRAGGYAHELTAQEHEQLIAILLTLKGKVLLSGYAHESYAALEKAGWTRRDWQTYCATATGSRSTGNLGTGAGAKQPRTETVWYNYPTP